MKTSIIFLMLASTASNSLHSGQWERYKCENGVMKNGVCLRDGCVKEGDPCNCGSGTESACSGLCFRGGKYGVPSLFCQCNLSTMSDEEIAALEKERGAPLPTDAACGQRPVFGFQNGEDGDDENLQKLVANLTKLAYNGTLFDQPYDSTTAVKIIISTSERIKKEIKTIYSIELGRSQDVVRASRIFEDQTATGRLKPCIFFKNVLKDECTKQNLAQLTLSKQAQELIMQPCQSKQRPRKNLDPCFCESGIPGTPKMKAGSCQVNKCVEPGKLRCHCD